MIAGLMALRVRRPFTINDGWRGQEMQLFLIFLKTSLDFLRCS